MSARRRMKTVSSWWYQLQGAFDDSSRYEDLNVVDIDMSCPPEFDPLGNRRINLAYISIGEAEDYRDYWPTLTKGLIIHENPAWPGNYAVKFWKPEWGAVVCGLVKKAQERGFDGVYLDKCDVIWDVADDDDDLRDLTEQMVRLISLVREVAGPDFVVVMQNAERLLTDKTVVSAIDAVAVEDLIYGSKKTGQRNDAAETAERIANLDKVGFPILSVEYLNDIRLRLDAIDRTPGDYVILFSREDRELSR